MADASAYEFRLPGMTFYRLSATVTLGVGAVVLFSMIFKLTSDQYLLVIPIGLIILLMVLGIVIARRELGKPKVCMDATAIRGYTLAGKQLPIAWGEPVTVNRPGEANIYLQVAGSGPAESLVIPVKIAMTPEFFAAVEKLAPAEHPLRKWMVDQTTGTNPARRKPSLWRLIQRAPTESFGFGTVVGFVVGLMYFGLVALRAGHCEGVSVVRILHLFAAIMIPVGLLTILNQWRLGDKWSNRIWYERVTSLIVLSSFGVAAAALVNNLFCIITTGKHH